MIEGKTRGRNKALKDFMDVLYKMKGTKRKYFFENRIIAFKINKLEGQEPIFYLWMRSNLC
jgi:hypothetical protein